MKIALPFDGDINETYRHYYKAHELAVDPDSDWVARYSQNKVLRKEDLPLIKGCHIYTCGGRVVVATSSSSHGVYWGWNGAELLFSAREDELVSRLHPAPVGYDSVSIARYLHDDANLSPVATLFEGVKRIPGGCLAFFSDVGQLPKLHSFLADPTSQVATKFDKNTFYDAIDSVSTRLVVEAEGNAIYLLVSGGLDGTVLLASLARQGAKIVAVYGHDGVYQNRINETLIQKLRELYPSADITYCYSKSDDLDGDKLRAYQLDRLKWLVKGNYLKKNYKLSLADFYVAKEGRKVAFAVNGYGIDELYMGGKGSATISSIYLPSVAKMVETIRSIGIFSRMSLDLLWFSWRIQKAFGKDDVHLARHLAVKLSGAGKSGGKLGYQGGRSAQVFRDALTRDAVEVADMLLVSMSCISTKRHLSRFIKLFSYYFVEQNHMVRFFNHGKAMGSQYRLPYTCPEIRQSLLEYHPGAQEMWRPKQLLHSYLRDICGIDYEAILKQCGARKLGFMPMIKKAVRGVAWSPLRRLLRIKKKKRTHTYREEILTGPRYFLEVREALPPAETFVEVQDALTKLDDGAYASAIGRDMESGRVSRQYSSKEVYNYAHLLIYLNKVHVDTNH